MQRKDMSETTHLVEAKKEAPAAVVMTERRDDNCYTMEYACLPLRSGCAELGEFMQQSPDTDFTANGSVACCSETCVSAASGSCAMLFAACTMTLFSLPYGLYRDGRRVISNMCITRQEEPESVVESDADTTIIECTVNTPAVLK